MNPLGPQSLQEPPRTHGSEALTTAGLLVRDDQGIHTEFDELHATLSLE